MVLGLENAVAPKAKEAARAVVVSAVVVGGFEGMQMAVRVNGLDTGWSAEDLEAVIRTGACAVLLPKVNKPADVEAARLWLGNHPLWAMVETTRSLFQLGDIAVAEGPQAVAAGTGDLAREMECRTGPDRAHLRGFLVMIVAAARSRDLAVLDGVYNDIADDHGFANECIQAVEMGFDGKTLVHPRQVAPCNMAFTPACSELERARAVIDAFEQPENRSEGAIRLDGRMVERLHLEDARRVVALFEACSTGYRTTL